jgi:hypothetical protein
MWPDFRSVRESQIFARTSFPVNESSCRWTFQHVHFSAQACAEGHVEMVKGLFTFPFPSVKDADTDGRTPRHGAASNVFSEICAVLLKCHTEPSIQGIFEKSPMQ